MEALPTVLEQAHSPPSIRRNRIAGAADLFKLWQTGKSAHTLRSYENDLRKFAAHLGHEHVNDAIREILSDSAGDANALCLTWRNTMLDQVREGTMASSTLNRRLAGLRSIIKLARMTGLVQWHLEVQGVKSKPVRNTAGPGLPAIQAMLNVARKQKNPIKAKRDVAVLRLLHDIGLRRAEVASLDVGDFEEGPDGATLAVMGKGRLEREVLPIPMVTAAAIRGYLDAREGKLSPTDPMFLSMNNKGGYLGRITGGTVFHLVNFLGRKVGLHVTPHMLRHGTATAFLDESNGNIRMCQRLLRHSSPTTTMRYDDARNDQFRSAASTVAALLV